jgi:hypothetical protein
MRLIAGLVRISTMWMTAALVAALSSVPAQANALSFTNIRSTYGVQGPTRSDARFLPGDEMVLAFDINGLKVEVGGKALYSIGLEAADSQGTVDFKQDPTDQESKLASGGDSVPGFASVQIGLDQPPGNYILKVSVTDRAARSSQSFTRPLQVIPKAFGLVRIGITSDPKAQVPCFSINFAAVGFARDQGSGQPSLTVAARMVDEAGRATEARPVVGEVKDGVPAQALSLPMQFSLELRQAGKFTVQMSATDRIAGASAAVSFPLTVQESKP